jgi:TolB protein
MHRSVRALPLLAGLCALIAVGCRDAQSPITGPDPDTLTTPPLLEAMIVSNTATTPAVYLSLPPNSVPAGNVIDLTIRSSGEHIRTTLIAGGMDPVPVRAAAGDTINVAIAVAPGDDTLRYIAVVPIQRPPVLVRTDPPPAKRDVPLNAILILVFSEPIKPAALTGAQIQLTLDGTSVPGSLAFIDPDNLVVGFTPSAPLLPDTTYQLVASQGIEDLDGAMLESTVTVSFTTQPGQLPAPAPRIAFASDREGFGHIYVVNPDGSDLRDLGPGGEPAWSWDGSRIAFGAASLDGTTADVLVMNADGSNRVRLGEGWSPSWSPDGSQIVFSVDTAIMVMNANGSNRQKLVNLQIPGMPTGSYRIRHPVWAPDGQSIMFGSYGGTAPMIYEQVFVMGTDGSNPHPISPDNWTKESPAWSPDGTQAAVFSWDDIPGGPGTYDNVLAIYDLATGQRTIYHRPHMQWLRSGLDFSPDGRYIAFTQAFSTMEQYGYRVLILDLQTGLVTPLLPEAVNPVNPNYFDTEPVWSRR